MSKYIAGSGSCFNPVHKIKGRVTNHVKDDNRQYFVSAEFVSELYTEEFWNNLSQLAKSNNLFLEIYA